MKQKHLFSIAVLLALSSACKKSTDGEDPAPPNSSDTLLLPPSTGWQHVMSIDTKDYALSVCDMTPVGQEIAVLYKSRLPTSHTSDYFKVKFKESGPQSAAGTQLGFSTDGRTVYYSQFVPESYTAVFTDMQYVGNIYGLIDENNTRTVRFVTDLTQPKDEFVNYYYTKAGDYLGAVINGAHIPNATQYGTSKFPPTPVTDGFMPTINTDKNRGNFVSKMAIPLKLSDNHPYTFTIGTDGNQLKYQALKLLPEKERIDPNYEIVDEGEFAGWQASGLESNNPYQSLVTFRYDNDVLTFVLADYKMVSGINVMNKLHGYRWKKGTAGLSTLWESAEVTPTLSNALDTQEAINDVQSRRYEENRLTPDGTLYTIHTKKLYTQPQPEKEYSILYTVNASGINELSRIDYLFDHYKKTVRINTCRYINGAYYALVYPIESEYIKADDPKYHIEVVKLTP